MHCLECSDMQNAFLWLCIGRKWIYKSNLRNADVFLPSFLSCSSPVPQQQSNKSLSVLTRITSNKYTDQTQHYLTRKLFFSFLLICKSTSLLLPPSVDSIIIASFKYQKKKKTPLLVSGLKRGPLIDI